MDFVTVRNGTIELNVAVSGSGPLIVGGPLNRYRARDLDFADLAELGGRGIAQPSAFFAGERDPVRA